jgi:hypothetical protein
MVNQAIVPQLPEDEDSDNEQIDVDSEMSEDEEEECRVCRGPAEQGYVFVIAFSRMAVGGFALSLGFYTVLSSRNFPGHGSSYAVRVSSIKSIVVSWQSYPRSASNFESITASCCWVILRPWNVVMDIFICGMTWCHSCQTLQSPFPSTCRFSSARARAIGHSALSFRGMCPDRSSKGMTRVFLFCFSKTPSFLIPHALMSTGVLSLLPVDVRGRLGSLIKTV